MFDSFRNMDDDSCTTVKTVASLISIFRPFLVWVLTVKCFTEGKKFFFWMKCFIKVLWWHLYLLCIESNNTPWKFV